MNRTDVLDAVRRILSLEESNIEGNLDEIERISLEVIATLKDGDLVIEDDIYQFLDDFDIRRKDAKYRDYQTRRIAEKVPQFRRPDSSGDTA